MKIISKYKDYYDYLSGVYGVDDKIVLDRRYSGTYEYPIFKFDTHMLSSHFNYGLTLHLCGISYGGVYLHKENKTFWCQELEKIMDVKNHYRTNEKYVIIKDGGLNSSYMNVYLGPRKTNFNEKYNIPILLQVHDRIYPFPQLDKIGFNRQMSPQEIYLKLSDWLSPKDNIENNMTDKEKIQSHGFDLKSSFRKMK
jgi:hypothetical protein